MSHQVHYYCKACRHALGGLNADQLVQILGGHLSSGVRATRAAELRVFAKRIGACGCAHPEPVTQLVPTRRAVFTASRIAATKPTSPVPLTLVVPPTPAVLSEQPQMAQRVPRLPPVEREKTGGPPFPRRRIMPIIHRLGLGALLTGADPGARPRPADVGLPARGVAREARSGGLAVQRAAG